MKALEDDLAAKTVQLFCCAAKPEIEIYGCAGWRDDLGVTWNTAREHHALKERFSARCSQSEAMPGARVAEGICWLQSPEELPLLFSLCPELRALRDRIAALLPS